MRVWHLAVLQIAAPRRLEPLENYVPAVVAAREQLAACGAQLGAGAACRLAGRQCDALLLPRVRVLDGCLWWSQKTLVA